MEFVRKGGNVWVEGWNGWQKMRNYQLPTPRVKQETHTPGGGIMDLEVPVGGIEPLELGINLISADPVILGGFGMSLHHRKPITIYELLQDELTGTKRERIISIRGIIAEQTPEEIAGRGMKGYGHRIRSITDYEDVIEGYGIVARFSFQTNSWEGYGITAGSADDNRILRIAGR